MKTLWKPTLKVWSFALFKIPLIFWLRPKVLFLSKQEAVIKIALNRRSKNHLNSMYFGALCVGADLAAGLHVANILGDIDKKIAFVFKDVKGEFLKRPEADVLFRCKEGDLIEKAIQNTMITHDRENVVVQIVATTPSISGEEPVARFSLTLSLKQY